jgi:RNA polymerase sigma factor (sigma-70 family)
MAMETTDQADDLNAEYRSRPDAALLEQFVGQRDPEAFAALMKRHGSYLLAVCRQLTQHTQDAEDVFQACFLQLFRKGPSIRQGASVAGWLQKVAVRIAHKLRARQARDRRRETIRPMTDTTESPADLRWNEACQILQEEIAQLPDDLRLPIILCLFEGLTQEAAAEQLGLNPRTVKDRLRRGREKLHKRLVTRGVSLAVLGTLLAGSWEPPVPAALAEATLRGVKAVLTKSSLADAVSPSVITLATPSGAVAGWVAITAAVALTIGAAGALTAWERLSAPAAPGTVTAAAELRGPVTVRRSFRGKQVDLEFFQLAGPNPELYLQPEEEGLRITLPEKNGPRDPVGVKLRYPVRGDIELEASFEFLNVPRPATGAGGVSLYLYLASPDRDGLWLGKVNDQLRGPLFNAGQRVGNIENRTDKFITNVPAGNETGLARVRLVRQGSSISMFAGDESAAGFVHLATLDVNTADCVIVRLAADPIWRPDIAIDVRLIDFTITAEEFVGFVPK